MNKHKQSETLRPGNQNDVFTRFAKRTSRAAGHPATFGVAVLIIVGWAIAGPFFGFSDAWQLAINSTTTIVTFLMVFLIHNTQNRDSDAIQIKLDELIRVSRAHNALLDLEELSQKDLDRIRDRYENLARKARNDLKSGSADTGTPQVRTE